MLIEARQLLDRIDAIVHLTRPGTEDHPGAAATDAVVAGLLRTLRPIGAEAVKRAEVGRILVVDDNESNRDLLRRRLVHEGHEVTTAASGREALDILAESGFDLILLDLLMPDMNGIEMLERLKADERWYHTPVVMISGLTETDAVIRCIEAGAEDYLPKPFNLVLLRARINACLERKRWRDRERDYLARLKEEKERSDEACSATSCPSRSSSASTAARRSSPTASTTSRFSSPTSSASLLPRRLMSPARLVDKLDRIFSEFDALASRLGVEKIKTIGDAYMAAAGLPEPRARPRRSDRRASPSACSRCSRASTSRRRTPFQIRIGMHTGPVVAGIIGRHKFIYDVWGDTVNVASRLESHGLPNRIQVSEAMRRELAHRYSFESRGMIELKGKGKRPGLPARPFDGLGAAFVVPKGNGFSPSGERSGPLTLVATERVPSTHFRAAPRHRHVGSAQA